MVEKLLNGLSLDDLPFPGLSLKELLTERNMQQKELAARLSMKEQTVSNIINGKDRITNDTAVKLEIIFGIPASFWNALQTNYDEHKLKIEMAHSVSEAEINLIKDSVYNTIVDTGYVAKTNDKVARVIQLRNLLGIPSLLNNMSVLQAGGFFRTTQADCDYLALAIWLKICEIETKNIQVERIDLKKIEQNLVWLKSLSTKSPNEFIPLIAEFFAKCGVAIKVVRNLPGVPVQGYIEQSDSKIILCLTIRRAFADIFWFTLFHELGHLLGDNLKKRFIDFDKNEEECKADEFATRTLISKESLRELLVKGVTKQNVIDCAKQNNVHTGIVVGRLQHENVIPYTRFCDLRVKYKWA